MTRANVTTLALAEQSAGIVRFIEMVMWLGDPVAFDLFRDGRWVLA